MIRLLMAAWIPAFALLVPALPAVGGAEPTQPKTVRLITVGNSFSQNATRYLEPLVKAAGHTLIHRPLSVGGASLELHWGKVQQFEADPTDPHGLYGKTSLRQELASSEWDVVTIQQASFKSHDVSTYRPFAKNLHGSIKKAAPKAEVVLHQTWAYRVDDPRFTRPAGMEGAPATRQAMHDGLTRSYEQIARELGVRLIPVGDAFQIADTDPKWGYKPDKAFDFATAKPPALPDQTHSLHTGWRWVAGKEGKSTLSIDGHHASIAGQYLGACVFYESLFGESSVGNTFVPKELDADYARFLQETAHKAVVNRRGQKP